MMSAKSFGLLCDDWMRENPDCNTEWDYDVGASEFGVSVSPFETIERGKKILAKASIPQSVDPKIVAVVLNLLKTQVGLYAQYGIRV